MDVRIICEDGTRILSADEEINSLLTEGWTIIETGVVSYVTSVDLSPNVFAFRLKEKLNTKVYYVKWEDLRPRKSIPMVFSEVQPFEINIERIKTTEDIMEKEKYLEEGWRLLKKIKLHSKSNFYKYILTI